MIVTTSGAERTSEVGTFAPSASWARGAVIENARVPPSFLTTISRSPTCSILCPGPRPISNGYSSKPATLVISGQVNPPLLIDRIGAASPSSAAALTATAKLATSAQSTAIAANRLRSSAPPSSSVPLPGGRQLNSSLGPAAGGAVDRDLGLGGSGLGGAAAGAGEVFDADADDEGGGAEDQDQQTGAGRAEDRGEEGDRHQAPEESPERLRDPFKPVEIRQIDPHGDGFDPGGLCPLSPCGRQRTEGWLVPPGVEDAAPVVPGDAFELDLAEAGGAEGVE